MSETDPEIAQALARGQELWAAGSRDAAHAEFERAYRKGTGDPRALSWFGMSTALHLANRQQGLLFCEEAVRRAGPDPQLLVNLARAALANKNKKAAARALYRAQDVDPTHQETLALLKEMGIRRRAVLPFLSRGNVLNRALGRLRHRLGRG